MLAFEIAPLGHIPDYDGLLVLGELEQIRGKLLGIPSVTQRVGGFNVFAIKF
jgi:hypothetical protein